MEIVEKSINGFKSEEIIATVKALQEDPELAKFQFRARNKWVTGGYNQSTIKDFYGGSQEDTSRSEPYRFNNGEPPILLGNNEGANPVEFVLHALAGCMTTTMVLHAAANNIPLDSVESQLEGDLDVQGFLGLNDKVRNGYQQIRVKFKIEGDLTAQQREQLYAFTQKSPVFDIVTNKVSVIVELN
ncbi:MAG: OsmC family protein [Candidatus Cyclobacteriaceae bacterium M3_2C_046]